MSKKGLMILRVAPHSFLALAFFGVFAPFHVRAAGPGEEGKSAAARSLLRQLDEGFVAVFEKVAPTVVVIEATKKEKSEEADEDARSFDFFFNDTDEPSGDPSKAKERQHLLRLPRQPLQSEGSGFIIRSDGFILTNQHVVANADKLEVRLKDGRIFSAKVVGTDDKTDIAVIKIEAKELAVAEFADSEKLRVGQLVCAIGAPFNQDYSFTCGWVSGKGRSNLLGGTSSTIIYEDYIQTDAFINPGNSGGPLFDVDGAVVGMNTLINGIGRGLAFAIPSGMLTDVSSQLIATGRVQRCWLGIRIESLRENQELRERVSLQRGIVVRTIEANAPVYRSDLRPADIITEIDGVRLNSAHDLQKEVLRKKVGQVLQLTVWRGGATLKIPVTTGELPGDFSKAGSPTPKKAPDTKPDDTGVKPREPSKAGVVVVKPVPLISSARADAPSKDGIPKVARTFGSDFFGSWSGKKRRAPEC